MAIQDHYTNGVPHLLDQFGKPIPLRSDTGRPDGSAVVGGLALPHSWTFIARHGGAYNSYFHDRYDEALRHSREDAEVMRRDAYLMALLDERKLAVKSLPWHLEVPDDKDPYQRRVRDGLRQIVNGIPNLRRIIGWLLEALWYGRHAVQVEWDWGAFTDRPEEKGGSSPSPLEAVLGKGTQPGSDGGVRRRCLTVTDALPVNGDKIGFQYDHTPYVLISGDKEEELPDADIIGTTRGRAMTLRGSWRERFIIHKHIIEDVDYQSSDQAGAIHGVGIRSKLFWLNWLKLEWLGNVTNFFDQVGLGVTLWKYPAGNEAAKQEALAAARNQSSRAHVLVPVWGEAGREALTGVERVEVPTSGADALNKLIEYIDKQIERYVVGQAGSSRAQAAGIGNEAATEFMIATKAAITMDDAHLLGVTLTGTNREPGLLNTMQRYTFPDADFPVKWTFDVEKPESERKLNAGRTLVEMGVEIAEDEFRAAAGYGKPAAGDKTVQPPQQPGAGGPPGMGLPGMGGPPGMDAPGAPPEPGAEEAPPEGEEQPQEATAEEQPQEQPAGDFLQALRMVREGQPERHAWVNMGLVKVSPTGRPLYRWYDANKRQSRIQGIPPGSRGSPAGKSTSPRTTTSSSKLDVGRKTRALLAAALELMFPGGWLRPSGLPALAGLDQDADVPADVSRDEGGGLLVALRIPGGRYELVLHLDGVLSIQLPSEEHLERARHALMIAGVDVARLPDDQAVDLTEPDDSIPAYIADGNEERRQDRISHSERLQEAFDSLVPMSAPASPATDPGVPQKHQALAQAVRYLRETGREEMAREVVMAYARRTGHQPLVFAE